jgi:hypothetical protein
MAREPRKQGHFALSLNEEMVRCGDSDLFGTSLPLVASSIAAQRDCFGNGDCHQNKRAPRIVLGGTG